MGCAETYGGGFVRSSDWNASSRLLRFLTLDLESDPIPRCMKLPGLENGHSVTI